MEREAPNAARRSGAWEVSALLRDVCRCVLPSLPAQREAYEEEEHYEYGGTQQLPAVRLFERVVEDCGCQRQAQEHYRTHDPSGSTAEHCNPTPSLQW